MRSEVMTAYAKLDKAREVFAAAIAEFQTVYEPNTVGLDYVADGLETTMFELMEDIVSEFGEQE